MKKQQKQILCTLLLCSVALAGCGKDAASGQDTGTDPTPAITAPAPTDAPDTAGENTQTEPSDSKNNSISSPTPESDKPESEKTPEECFQKVFASKSYKEKIYRNPVMTQRFGADPYAMVYDGRVYLYMSGDVVERDAGGSVKDNSFGKINTICVLSSSDLVNWTDHGTVYAAGRDGAATWANNSWAPAAACKEIDGKMKFFLYFANNGGGIGVLTSDSPVGPFTDPLGKPLLTHNTANCSDVLWMFDPAVLVDDDNRAYLYFGGGVPNGQEAHPMTARVVELGDDMISLAGTPVTIDSPYHFEDSGINKFGDTYYYSYCTNWSVDAAGSSEYKIASAQIAYMTSDNPLGPFTPAGSILKNPGQYFGSYGTNHHCMFEFNGNYYITYHTQILEGPMGISGGYRCSHVDDVKLRDDGSIAPITATKFGSKAVAALNPFVRTEAETMQTMGGIGTTQYGESEACGSGNMVVNEIDTGDWILVSGVDFGNGASSFCASTKTDSATRGIIRISLDSHKGDVIGYLEVSGTPEENYSEHIITLTKEVSGVHDVYFTFYGSDYTFDYWYFTK